MKLFQPKFFAFVILIFSANLIFAGKFKKEIKKTYNADKYSALYIDNQFGNVDIVTKEISTIQVKVTIIVDADDQKNAEKAMSKININITDDSPQIRFVTALDNNMSKISFKINYTIELPSSIMIDASNKYGDMFANELAGEHHLRISYGSLRIDRIINEKDEKRATIDVAYSNATVSYCKWLDVDMKYSKIDIGEAQAISLNSKYSRVNIGKASSVVAISKYDVPFSIGELSNIKINSSYSNFNIGKVNRKIMAIMRYSDCNVGEVSAQFNGLELDLQYGNMSLPLQDKLTYTIDALSQYGQVRLPQGNNLSIQQSNTQQKYSGTVGNGKASCSVKAETRYATLNLMRN